MFEFGALVILCLAAIAGILILLGSLLYFALREVVPPIAAPLVAAVSTVGILTAALV